MNITCQDRDRILEDGSPAEWAALEAHSAACPGCAEELRAWKALSAAAQELRDYSDSPSLWPRIERSLAENVAAEKGRKNRWSWLSFGAGISHGWQLAAAAACVLILTVSVLWFYQHRLPGQRDPDQSLLKSPALAEVERTQAAYQQAIDKLAVEAKPQIENPTTALQASYREKLLVLDSAIDDLRAQAGLNPSNAYLRQQLLAMYQEKQQTLQEILEDKR
jgi:anti-sigma factor RsiW